jgi:hypothetical protein
MPKRLFICFTALLFPERSRVQGYVERRDLARLWHHLTVLCTILVSFLTAPIEWLDGLS